MKLLVAGLVLIGWVSSALAQGSAVTSSPAPWDAVGSTVSLSVTTTSGSVQLGWVAISPTPPPASAWMCNTGSNGAYVVLGSSSVVATSAGMFVPSGTCNLLAIKGQPYLAALTASSTTTLIISSGNGDRAAAALGSSGGGVSSDVNVATINGVTPLMGTGNTGTGSPRVTIATDQVAQATAGQGATAATAPSSATEAGCVAQSAEASAVTTGQMGGIACDLVKKLIVLPYANPENFVSGVTAAAMTGTTSTSLIAAPAGSLRNYITSCTFSNSHATVGTDIILQDGSGGTTIWNVPAAAVYGGAQVIWPTPLRQPTTATALYVANVTTGSSTKAACAGYKGL